MPSCSSTDNEYDSDEPPQLDLGIEDLLDRASDILNARCTSAERLTRGANHEVFLLSFEEGEVAHQDLAKSGYCCIARFTRVKTEAAVTRDASEIATLRYLKNNTNLPVPEVYHQDLNLENTVGAPYVLMSWIPGCHLYKIWHTLSLDHKKAVISQIASIIVHFASLSFGLLGNLHEEGVGPVINPSSSIRRGPFRSTDQYFLSFASIDHVQSQELVVLFQQIQQELEKFLLLQKDEQYLQPPFCMIHADLDGQDLLFSEQPDGSPPKLSGIIDFEYSHTGPFYFLYEYPIFIQDVSWSKELHAENAILRHHFVRQVYEQLPDTESRKTFIACMNGKSFVLNSFQASFMSMECSENSFISLAKSYLESVKEGMEPPYSGRLDYTPELYSDDGNLVSTDG